MKRTCVVVVSALTVGLGGCGVDTLEIIEQPAAVAPGEAYTVTLANMFMLLSNGSTLSQAVERDSLHLGIGLPKGWDATSAMFYVAENFNVAGMAGMDTVAMLEALTDSAELYATRLQPMSPDENMAEFFAGKTFDLDIDTLDSPLSLAADSVDQWSGFGAAISLDFPMGHPMDTAFALDELDSSMTADTSSIPIAVDSMGMSVVPILITVSVSVTADTGAFSVYYYGKTAALPGGSEEFDTGDWAVGSVRVTTVDARPRGVGAPAQNPILITRGAQGGTFHIALDPESAPGRYAGIYSPGGNLIRRLRPSPGAHEIFWDGRSHGGDPVPNGSYFVKVEGGLGGVAQPLHLIRR